VLADNFEVYSGRRGCDSIVKERERRDCQDLQRAKNDACNQTASCDMDRQKRDIDEFNEVKKQLADGRVADSDKPALERKIRDLEARLNARKAAAPDVMKIAQGCIDARAKVQDWFKNVGIPVTERARDDAMKLRKELVDKLREADERRRNAKEKRDANPNDSSAKDEYERAAEKYREAEKALEQFSERYGRDVERTRVDWSITITMSGLGTTHRPRKPQTGCRSAKTCSGLATDAERRAIACALIANDVGATPA